MEDFCCEVESCELFDVCFDEGGVCSLGGAVDVEVVHEVVAVLLEYFV